MKPFLILQLRPIDLASDNEFEAFLKYGGLKRNEVHRIRMEKNGIPNLDLNDFSGVLVGGGPSNVSDEEDIKEVYQKKFELDLNKLLDKIFRKDHPFLGTCYGIGAVAKFKGAVVSKEKYSEEVGALQIKLTLEGLKDKLTSELPIEFVAFGGHKEACQELPNGATLLASSNNCPVQMMRFKENIYATQFHTELDREGIILRIKVYKDHGYFSPSDAEKLIRITKKHDAKYPRMILKKFIECYKVG